MCFIELFVPGRICLFGEHSDWSGGFRRMNPELGCGEVVIAGTEEGLYARARKSDDGFRIIGTRCDGVRKEALFPMDAEELLQVARRGEFFSYAAGVARYMLTQYGVGGLELDNYKTSLPIKKGLSSSAAICVLIARAFNRVYGLNLSIRDEMEAAYQGERMTPSKCGRMDQGCAFGSGALRMTFDGDTLSTQPVAVGSTIHLLIADLKGKKDTVKILSDLTRWYPRTNDPIGQHVQAYLGDVNRAIVSEAIACLERGDAAGLGALMTRAQNEFDRHLQPSCPEELTAPKLHAVLNDPRVRELAYGGKGIGSQGDGSVQLVAKSEAERNELAAYLRNQLGLDCFTLNLRPSKSVRKALIPAAGLGTRMFPATKVVKKELFPVVTPEGRCKPLIQTIVEEAFSAGAEEIGIIVRPNDEPTLAGLFSPVPEEYFNQLPDWAQEECRKLQEMGRRITFIHQTEQLGFGHAVYQARQWIGDEPVLLMLGDHIYSSKTEVSCARQLVDAFEAAGSELAIVSVYPAPGSTVHHYGTVAGEWTDVNRKVLKLSQFAEKPSLDYARKHLAMKGLIDDDQFLCVYGQYILTPELFDILGNQIARNIRQKNEFQLTTALEELRAKRGMLALMVDGWHYDTGQPKEYLESLLAYSKKQ